jgi:energy-coupling factor transporter ATP-binding protein EcfA2
MRANVSRGLQMQYFDRGAVPPPASFRNDAARGERDKFLQFMEQDAGRRSQTSPSSSRFQISETDTYDAVNKLFRGKCAFCEGIGAVSPRLFRPGAEALPLAKSEFAHLYYAWLRTDWGNVYPVCVDCSTSAGTQFPVRVNDRGELPAIEHLRAFAQENYGLWRWGHADQSLLLDPCLVRSFVRHFSFSLKGEIQAFTEAGAQTIAVFNLDRDSLNHARGEAFRSHIDLLRSELERGIAPNVFNFAALEFGGGWALLLRRLVQRINQRLDGRLSASTDQLPRTLALIWRTAIGRTAFESTLEDVAGPVPRATVARPKPKGQTRRLVSVEVKNFKSLQNIRLRIPPNIPADLATEREAEAASLLVLGENAAGKSSILEAVALALTDERNRQSATRPAESFILDPRLMGSNDFPAPKQAEVRLEFEDGSALELAISDRFEERGATDDLPPVFAYGAFRQFVAKSSSKPPRDHVGTLFKSEALLANPEAWLLGLDGTDFAMVVRAISRILTIEGEFDVIKPDPDNARCLIVSQVGEGVDVRSIMTPLKVVSSGFRSVLAMVCDILAGLIALQRTGDRKNFGDFEAVILIDEVEAHLHPRWKMQIMAALRRVLPKATIIVTTHDPLCLRGMHDQEVVVFNRTLRATLDDAEDLPVFVETISELPNVENLTLEQLLTSDFFAMFSTDSPTADHNLARLGAIIARQAKGEELTAVEVNALQELRLQVFQALPLGSSEVQRLVESAVLKYLQNRRGQRSSQLEALKDDARDEIVRALEAY